MFLPGVPNNQILEARIGFEDGSYVNTGILDNCGLETSVRFPPKRTTFINVTILRTSATTETKETATGLAEIFVFESSRARPHMQSYMIEKILALVFSSGVVVLVLCRYCKCRRANKKKCFTCCL